VQHLAASISTSTGMLLHRVTNGRKLLGQSLRSRIESKIFVLERPLCKWLISRCGLRQQVQMRKEDGKRKGMGVGMGIATHLGLGLRRFHTAFVSNHNLFIFPLDCQKLRTKTWGRSPFRPFPIFSQIKCGQTQLNASVGVAGSLLGERRQN